MTEPRFDKLRFIPSAVILILCCYGISVAWHTGLGRFLANDAAHTLIGERADRAVAASPGDAETHAARALVLYQAEELNGSIGELENSASLRPQDYLLWLQIGRARDEAGDMQGALLALQEALRLAPFYSDPRWQYGNVLYRAGRFDEAFRELGAAAASDPALSPVLMDLAWGTYPGDAKAVEAIVLPRTDAGRISLARFFVKKGLIDEALTLFRSSEGGALDERSKLLRDLMQAKRFKAAYEVWVASQPVKDAKLNGNITDPGFEGPLVLNSKGFAWRQERAFEGVTVSLDSKHPRSGANSLLIEWRGHATPEVPVVTQLVLAEPGSRYRLSFFVRTEDVVTGGLPLISITDASDEKFLAQSQPFAPAAGEWQQYEVAFATSSTTGAVTITLQRQSCAPSPCPMFGRVWLDDFSLQKE